jgi:hypothetical protein
MASKGSGPNRLGPTVPRMQNQTKSQGQLNGTKPSGHHALRSRSCSRRTEIATLGNGITIVTMVVSGRMLRFGNTFESKRSDPKMIKMTNSTQYHHSERVARPEKCT